MGLFTLCLFMTPNGYPRILPRPVGPPNDTTEFEMTLQCDGHRHHEHEFHLASSEHIFQFQGFLHRTHHSNTLRHKGNRSSATKETVMIFNSAKMNSRHFQTMLLLITLLSGAIITCNAQGPQVRLVTSLPGAGWSPAHGRVVCRLRRA